MKVHVYPLNIGKHRGSFDLYLLGDVHLGAITCDEDLFINTIDEIKENSKKRITKTILMGDYGNVFTKFDKRNNPDAQKITDSLQIYTEFRNIIKPISNTVIACLTGNHDLDWFNMENIDYVNWLCAETKMPYSTYESYIRLKVFCEDSNSKRNIDILAWHGDGGGRTAGSAFNKVRYPVESFRNADIVAMGHLHRLGMLYEDYIDDINEEKLDVVARRQHFVLTGGFLKGYESPETTYISKKMLPPVALGAVKLTVQPFKSPQDSLDIGFSIV